MLTAVLPAGAAAADVALVGLMSDKAIVVIDGGQRQWLAVGGPAVAGVKLVAIEPGAAIFEIDGKRRRMQIGQSVVSAPQAGKPTLVLNADAPGCSRARSSRPVWSRVLPSRVCNAPAPAPAGAPAGGGPGTRPRELRLHASEKPQLLPMPLVHRPMRCGSDRARGLIARLLLARVLKRQHSPHVRPDSP
ncbi:MAG: hypothetical protein HXY19_05575 [Thermoanaerobaculaceae bacterium]|nr:hypothetical protein [Thermoanaerobaculaceae bacterium]